MESTIFRTARVSYSITSARTAAAAQNNVYDTAGTNTAAHLWP